MISFGLTEEEKVIKETVQKFAQTEIRPLQRTCEEKEEVPDGLRRKYHELGLATLDYPESVGGQNLGMTTRAIVEEELSWGDAGIAGSLDGLGMAGYAIMELGNEEQKKKYLESFCDPSKWNRRAALGLLEPRQGEAYWDLGTTARNKGDGYVLNGKKSFVVNGGIADIFVVFATIDKAKEWDGLRGFVIEKGAKGISLAGRTFTCGLNTMHIAEVTLENCEIGSEGLLSNGSDFRHSFLTFLARANVVSAARTVGIARASVEYAIEYAEQRVAFGQPIAQHQGLGWMLADMATEVDAARWMTWRAASALDKGLPSSVREAAKALVQANVMAAKVTIDSVQILGGAGFCRDYPVEKWMRDARTQAFFTGTDQVYNQLITALTMTRDGKEKAA